MTGYPKSTYTYICTIHTHIPYTNLNKLESGNNKPISEKTSHLSKYGWNNTGIRQITQWMITYIDTTYI